MCVQQVVGDGRLSPLLDNTSCTFLGARASLERFEGAPLIEFSSTALSDDVWDKAAERLLIEVRAVER